MWKEFREFISRGNVIDLAVAVAVGGAFNKIVTSLVNDIITPILGIFLGQINFSALAIQIGKATIQYGSFIQTVINFLLTAFAMFLIVQTYNRFKRKEEKIEEIKKLVEPSQEVLLLMQIRDALTDGKTSPAAAPAQPGQSMT